MTIPAFLLFGDTVPGNANNDVWRDGNFTSPMYATYAAQAWLRNGQTATVIRLLGHEDTNYTSNTTGRAGWGNYTETPADGGAYGLFIIGSGSAGTTAVQADPLTGALAAVWYFPSDGGIVLTGSTRGDGHALHARTSRSGSGRMFLNSKANYGFDALIWDGSTTTSASFNFNEDDGQYIRKVFNTNPTVTNTGLVGASDANYRNYFLGHTYDRFLNDTVTSSAASQCFGMILKLGGISGVYADKFSDFKFNANAASSGWIISQDVRATGSLFDARTTGGNGVTKLFKIHSRNVGDWDFKHLKISIANIKASNNADVDPFGSFDVILRRAQDTDNNLQIIERFTECNLNPNSANYIARKIGDTYATWDDTERRFREYGEYPNVSKHVRVEVNENATNPILLPFGFWGPDRPVGFQLSSGSAGATAGCNAAFFKGVNSETTAGATFATSSGNLLANPHQDEDGDGQFGGVIASSFGKSPILATSSFLYPAIRLRLSSSDAQLSDDKAAYFGYDSRKKHSNQYDTSNVDILRVLPGNPGISSGVTEISVAFTLDDIYVSGSGDNVVAEYISGSRQNTSVTQFPVTVTQSATANTQSYTAILDHGFNKFTVPMWGGFDGWDVRESDPVANRNLDDGTGQKDNYAFNTMRRGIDACAHPEEIDFNIMVAPGVTNVNLTDHMASVCEDRGDAIAITDLPDVYHPRHEGTGYEAFTDRTGNGLSSVVSTFKTRRKNTSYACTYYPWVQIRDSLNNASVWVPPSVVALGTFSHSDRVSELWFAPAGFNRGGLSQGSAGLTVTNVSERLTSDNRDSLYEVNINPIASFPNEGIVIFGQKTMDATTSALSRINVRRLLIFLKKEISRLSNQVLFDQNVPATWARFRSLVVPLLQTVKTRFGLTDYRLILDETTTTPDLIDRNVMYAKILLKPARAIEFIALDFVVTRTGASFDD